MRGCTTLQKKVLAGTVVAVDVIVRHAEALRLKRQAAAAIAKQQWRHEERRIRICGGIAFADRLLDELCSSL